MVDVKKIERELNRLFRIKGHHRIDPRSGIIHIQGDIAARDNMPGDHLPLQFGTVTGNFDLFTQNNLKDLQGSPHTVGGEFFVVGYQITNLTGAPRHVTHRCVLRSYSLKSLEHLPESCSLLRLDITPELPLLRLTSVNYRIILGYAMELTEEQSLKMDKAAFIMKKYAGTGKAGALKAALELYRVDCKDNARW